MRRTLTFWTVAVLVVATGSSVVLGQGAANGDSLTLPFGAAAIARAVAKQSTVSTPSSRTDGWFRVSSLQPGSDVHVLIQGRGTLERRLIRAGSNELLLLNVGNLPRDLRDACLRLVRENPGLFDEVATGKSFASRVIRIGPDGIRNATNAVVARIEDVLERVARDSVLEISIVATNPRKTLGRLGLGLFATSTVVNVVESRRRCGCPDMVPTPAGITLLAGGLIAMAASGRYPKIEKGTRSVVFKRD